MIGIMVLLKLFWSKFFIIILFVWKDWMDVLIIVIDLGLSSWFKWFIFCLFNGMFVYMVINFCEFCWVRIVFCDWVYSFFWLVCVINYRIDVYNDLVSLIFLVVMCMI